MTDLVDASVDSWEPLSAPQREDEALWSRLASFERLGASVEELAKETIESIMGFQGKGGHKPPRPDIQKYKDAYDLFRSAKEQTTPEGLDESDLGAQEEWGAKFGLNEKEQGAVALYKYALTNRSGDFYNDPQKAFDFVARMWSMPGGLEDGDTYHAINNGFAQTPEDPPTQEAKQFLGNALKKYEMQNYPMLYASIDNALSDAYRRGPYEAYKIYPRVVSWIKEVWQEWLAKHNQSFNRQNQSPSAISQEITHILDVALPAAKVLDQLRRENKLPQGFDVNKVSFKDFEKWYMEWKQENLGSENAGEVVYEFHDKWTIQKLTTPEQLQYEGDTMGHCVGDYAHAVEEGQTIIYSLRDSKDNPHVTMEVHALEGAPLDGAPGWADGGEEPEDAAYNHEYIHPDQHNPGDHMETASSREGYKPTGETAFEVIQVQGNSNLTPKPEYQRKIKEFLDYLRSKGWKFERSGNWFHNYDDPRQQEYGGEGAPTNARELDEWYDNHYKTNHKQYQNAKTDAYGMPAERVAIGIGDWEEMFKDILYSLVNEYDRSRFQGNWKDLAQAVYHAWSVDIYKDHLSPAGLESHKKNLLGELEKAEEHLTDLEMQNADNHYQYGEGQEEQLQKFEELAEKEGVWDKIEQELDDTIGDTYPTGERERALEDIAHKPEYEELWMEARDAMAEEVNNDYSEDARAFCQYIYMLAEKHGMLNPGDLPDPNQQHGGLPSFDELSLRPWQTEEQLDAQNVHPMSLPGAMSSWQKIASPVVQLGWDDLPDDHREWMKGGNEGGIVYATPDESQWPADIRTPAMHYPEDNLLVVGQPGWTHGDVYEALKARGEGQAGFGIEHAYHAGDPSLDVPARWNVQDDSTFRRFFEPDEADLADGTSLVPQRDEYLKQVMPLLQEARPAPLYRGTQHVATDADPIQIHPIDMEHNVWFDTDGNQRERFRPGWAKNPETGRSEQTGELEDTFLDKHGRQGQGFVAYHGEKPVGSLTYVDDQGWQMLGTAFVHPEYREQGLFNQLAAPLRESGRPTDAYVWENPWLKHKVRGWHTP